MGARKPKLLVLGGPHVDADALGVSLGELFELVESSPGEAIATMEYEGCQVVLAEAGDFVPLERGLVGRQSSMLLNAIGEGVCLSDVTGRVLWSNTMYRGFHEAVRRRVREVCVHGAAHFKERLARSAEKGGRVHFWLAVVTTSTWPWSSRAGAAPRPGRRAIKFGRDGVLASKVVGMSAVVSTSLR